MSRSGRKRSRRRKPLRAISIMGIILCLASVSGIGTVTLAKYINGEESGWLQIRPEKFYFTSDILEKSGRQENVHKLYNWTPENAYAFIIDIRNWEDDLHVTPKDISYSVKAESRDLHEVTGAVGGIQGTDYTIAGGNANTQELVITVPGGQTAGTTPPVITVTVKAKPKSGIGYTRTLKGTFELNKGDEDCVVKLESHNAYIDLIIGVDRGQTVTVSWPSCLTPDNTNIWMKGTLASPYTVKLENDESCRLRFFITGDIQTGDQIQVTDEAGTGYPKQLKQ